MPQKLLKRLMPSPETLKSHPSLAWLAHWLHEPYLWHLSRNSAARALAIGLFCSCLPLPGHMLMATGLSLWLRANLPVAVLSCWANNPLTMGPVYYGGYRLGAWLLGYSAAMPHFELSLSWLAKEFELIGPPLLLGCTVLGVGAAATGYLLLNTLWRCQARSKWAKRKQRIRRD